MENAKLQARIASQRIDQIKGEIERADAIGKWKILRRIFKAHPEWVQELVHCPRFGGWRLRRPADTPTDGIVDRLDGETTVERDRRHRKARKTADPATGAVAPITPYSSSRIGASPDEAAARALTQRSSPKISGE